MDKSNARIADFFRRLADLLEIAGDNPYKTRSYRIAADTFEGMTESVARAARAGGATRLQAIPGVGKSIAAQTVEFVETGTSTVFDELVETVPETVTDLLLVRGVGPKTAQVLYGEFGILSLDDLLAFAQGGGLEIVPGIADRGLDRMLVSIKQAVVTLPSSSLSEARKLAEQVSEKLRSLREPPVAVGGIRRARTVVRSVDLLAVAKDPGKVTDAFAALVGIGELTVRTPSRGERVLGSGLRVVLHAATPGDRACALVRTTGSDRHVRELAERARARELEFRRFELRDASGPQIGR